MLVAVSCGLANLWCTWEESRVWIPYSGNVDTKHEEKKQAGFAVVEVFMWLNLVSEKCLPGFVLPKSNISPRSLVQLLAKSILRYC
jgi:hypothetical protein